MPFALGRLLRYSLLILAATASFWFSPAPRTEDEYCGTYLHLTSYAGFTANCDGFEYLESARYPGRVLEPRAVRQSRPLYVLLGTAVGYPATWAVQGLQAGGLLPAAVMAKLPAKYQPLLGFYIGYVLLNFGLLLGALTLLGLGPRFRPLRRFWPAALAAAWYLRRNGAAWPIGLAELLGLVTLLTGFLAALGYYQERLTFMLVPLLLLVVGLALARWAPRRRGTVLVLAAALGWHIWQVVSYGPFS